MNVCTQDLWRCFRSGRYEYELSYWMDQHPFIVMAAGALTVILLLLVMFKSINNYLGDPNE